MQFNEDEDNEDASRCPGNAFQAQMCRCEILTAMVKSNGDNKDVSKGLDKLIEQLTKKIASRKKKGCRKRRDSQSP
jgi:ribosome-associated translation inhibitor RaiA